MKKTSSINTMPMFALFEQFIADTKKGRRLQPDGRGMSKGTIQNYETTLRLLKRYAEKYGEPLINISNRRSSREAARNKNYWIKFYKRFTGFLGTGCNYSDNYSGLAIKVIRTFFGYLNKDRLIQTGEFYKNFYVLREEVRIFPLLPEQLNFLIYDQAFEQSLSKRLRETKDVFVFGCTTMLRVSDLLSLKRTQLRKVNDTWFLSVRSHKTNTDTLMKLPPYATSILEKYKQIKPGILPEFNKSNFNQYVKKLSEAAGFTDPVHRTRQIKGRAIEMKRIDEGKKTAYRQCDMVSTHTMRRTGITTMLSLGVPEQVVKKLSGHAPSSRDFYRYVELSEAYISQETDTMFEKLASKRLNG